MKLHERIAHFFAVRFRLLSIRIQRVVRFITYDMWRLNMDDLARGRARFVRDAKVMTLTLRTFTAQKIGFQATALSYQCVMAIVPFIAIAFYLTSGVGLSDRLSALLYANVSNEQLINNILDAADNILTTAQSGLFGLISMLTFLWIVIWLMISVRRVFNNVWKVRREQKFLQMIGVVIGIIILAPFVILLFFTGSIVYTHVLDLLVPSQVAFSEHIKSLLGWLIYGAAAVMIISAMYKYIPGTHVHYHYALKAAILAGIAFTVLQYLYLETQVMVTKVSTVYGALAALPLFLAYLHLGWTVILYGAELSYAFQNVEHYTVEQIDNMNQEALKEAKRKRREM